MTFYFRFWICVFVKTPLMYCITRERFIIILIVVLRFIILLLFLINLWC